MSSRFLAALAAVFLAAACSPGAGDATTTSTDGTSTTIDGSAPSTAAPTSTSATTLPPGTEELPEEVRTQLAELISLTERARQLEFIDRPNVVVVSNDELADRVRQQLEEDLEDLPADQALYDLLGLIEDGTDLGALYSDLYSEQVAGYYDGEVRELVVPMAEEGFTPVQKATLVHELTHALTDQHYGFHDRYSEMLDNDLYDQATAYQALIEGDAVLAEFIYLQGLTPQEQGEFFAESFGVDTEVFDAAPQFIRDALIFPYDSGFIFTDRLNQSGGFGAIGAAYQDPPTSSEQIIDPSDYPADGPIEVELPAVAVEGYELEYQSTWGELGFTIMFDQFLEPSTTTSAAGGWGGDTYQLLFNGTDVVLVMRYRGDSAADADELGAALRAYIPAAMDVEEDAEPMEDGTGHIGEDHAWVRIEGSDVFFVAASDGNVLGDAVSQVVATINPPDTTGG
jgi:hypothetical protein